MTSVRFRIWTRSSTACVTLHLCDSAFGAVLHVLYMCIYEYMYMKYTYIVETAHCRTHVVCSNIVNIDIVVYVYIL